MTLLEWSVSCEWCGAKIGEPCVNNINGKIIEIYQDDIHIMRRKKYDSNMRTLSL